jgi:hypothetical protein
MKAYQTIVTNEKYSSIRWIANVLFTSCGKPAKRLAALIALVDAGREIGALDFVMPYEGLRVDGVAVVTMPMLDRSEAIPYGADWYKH